MTWLTILRLIAPYAISAALGFGVAWQIQGLRVTAAEQDLIDYQQDQEAARITAEKQAEKRRKETADDYRKKLEQLDTDYQTYMRCVAAGKCGARIVRVPALPNAAGSGISPTLRPDAAGANAIPAAGEVAAEDAVLKDCARTTLQLNQLQFDIEKQVAP